MPVLVLIRNDSAITADKMDKAGDGYTKQEKQTLLEKFKETVMKDGNTVDFFTDINATFC